MKTGKKKVVSIFLLIIGLILLIGLIKIQGWKNILDALRGARVSWIAASVVVYYFGVLVRAFKSYYLLKSLHYRMRFRDFVPLYLISSIMGTITPMRSGESALPFLLKKHLKSSIGSGFSIVFTDRVFELIVLLLLMSTSTAYMVFSFELPSILLKTLGIGFIILLLIVAILIFISFKRSIALTILAYLEKSVSKTRRLNLLHRVLSRISQEFGKFYEGLALFNKGIILKYIFFLTVVAWGFELSAFYLLAKSLINISFLVVISCQIITAGVALASFIPAGIGSANVSFVYLLSLAGYPKTESTAISLLAPSLWLGSLSLFATFSFVFLRLRLKNANSQ